MAEFSVADLEAAQVELDKKRAQLEQPLIEAVAEGLKDPAVQAFIAAVKTAVEGLPAGLAKNKLLPLNFAFAQAPRDIQQELERIAQVLG